MRGRDVTLDAALARVAARRKKRMQREKVLKQRGIRPKRLDKAKMKRLAAQVAAIVRALCVERDGYCRSVNTNTMDCRGVSQWSHFGEFKRARTRNQSAERRHNTAGSLMLCQRHHDAYAAGQLHIDAQTDRGCDGPLTFTWNRPEAAHE